MRIFRKGCYKENFTAANGNPQASFFGVVTDVYLPGTLNNHVLMDGNGETTIFYVMIWNHPTETSHLINGWP